MKFRQIFVCATPGRDACGVPRCGERGGEEVFSALQAEAACRGLDPSVVQRNGCTRRHHEGPVVFIFPDDVLYTEVSPEDASQIIERHLAPATTSRSENQGN